MGRVVLASLATLAASTDFLALVSDHGSGSGNVSQRLKKLGPCVLSVGELFSPQEQLVGNGGKKGHGAACAKALRVGRRPPLFVRRSRRGAQRASS